MKFCLALAVVIILVTTTHSFAAGPYVGAAGAVAFLQDSDEQQPPISYNTGVGFLLVGGYVIDPIRIEFEFGNKTSGTVTSNIIPSGNTAFRNGGGPPGDLNIKSYMLNGYWDIKNDSKFIPFVGAGLGMITGAIDPGTAHFEDTEFGYQATVGAAYCVNQHVSLDLAYRYQATFSDYTLGNLRLSYGGSNILAGLRYMF